jgi:hypothetical protein
LAISQGYLEEGKQIGALEKIMKMAERKRNRGEHVLAERRNQVSRELQNSRRRTRAPKHIN